MKFGKFLAARRAQSDDALAAASLDYNALKTFIKDHVAPYNLTHTLELPVAPPPPARPRRASHQGLHDVSPSRLVQNAASASASAPALWESTEESEVVASSDNARRPAAVDNSSSTISTSSADRPGTEAPSGSSASSAEAVTTTTPATTMPRAAVPPGRESGTGRPHLSMMHRKYGSQSAFPGGALDLLHSRGGAASLAMMASPSTLAETAESSEGHSAACPDLGRFAAAAGARLAGLQAAETSFFTMLTAEVDRVFAHYIASAAQLDLQGEAFFAEYGTGSRPASPTTATAGGKPTPTVAARALLDAVVALERALYINYTGIRKILKKNDRHTGLQLGEAYLTQLGRSDKYPTQQTVALKQRLMNFLAGNHAAATSASATASGSNAGATSPTFAIPLSPTAAATLHRMSSPDITLSPAATAAGILSSPKQATMSAVGLGFDLPQRILISIAGDHGTDIINTLLEATAAHGLGILDFSLARRHHHVTFGAVVVLTSEAIGIFSALTEAARRWDAQVTFDAVQTDKSLLAARLEDAPYQDRTKYMATVLNQHGLKADFLAALTRMFLERKISIETMTRLSDATDKLTSIDYRLSVPRDVVLETLRTDLIQLSRQHATDVAVQPHNVFRKNKRLVVFDMDSTLIQQEVIDEIAKHAGVVEQVAAITEAAMNGELDFSASLRARVALLEGLPLSVLQDVKAKLVFTEGAHALCRCLKRLGYKLAVISGGFTPLANYVKQSLDLDYAFANNLQVTPDGTRLTGKIAGPIVDGLRKAELLSVIAQAESVLPSQVIAVGDGANDLWMLAAAGLGIAFHAKPKVQERAPARINQPSLMNVLHLLGYSEEDARQLVQMD